jgi:hypothetical protein
LLNWLMAGLDLFVGNTPQHDDVTCMFLKAYVLWPPIKAKTFTQRSVILRCFLDDILGESLPSIPHTSDGTRARLFPVSR